MRTFVLHPHGIVDELVDDDRHLASFRVVPDREPPCCREHRPDDHDGRFKAVTLVARKVVNEATGDCIRVFAEERLSAPEIIRAIAPALLSRNSR